MKKRNPNEVHIDAKPNETDNQAIVRALFKYPLQASDTIFSYLQRPYSEKMERATLTAALQIQVDAVNRGDMKNIEGLLTAQAFTLDAIFNRLAQRAQVQENDRWFELFLKLGLRAQAQCARTLETLSAIKNPPVVFARQANVATNQQINVGTQAGPPPTSQPTAIDATPQPQPQLEHTHGNYLDAGTPAATGREDTAMAAVAEVHRTADG